MHLEHFGGGEDRRDRNTDDGRPEMVPGLQEIPWPTPGEDKTPDIPPAERQKIIDDITRQEEEEKERVRQIDEGGPFPPQEQDETPPTYH